MTTLIIVMGAVVLVCAALAIGAVLGGTRTPAPEAVPPRVPEPAPVPGQPEPPSAHGLPPRPAPAPAPGGHGGDVTTVVIKRCGYMIITDHDKGEAEIYHGECDTCDAAGKCHLCGFYMQFDQARRRWVQRYERCPAHAGKERQP